MPYQKKGMEMTIKKLKQYDNAKIDEHLLWRVEQCLELMKTGMTLSIRIGDNKQISITYYKN